ncbi:hypothetical protein O9929_01740 [Vibrio lentus]|nr:hypothetical protein [Vibrio lentus]
MPQTLFPHTECVAESKKEAVFKVRDVLSLFVPRSGCGSGYFKILLEQRRSLLLTDITLPISLLGVYAEDRIMSVFSVLKRIRDANRHKKAVSRYCLVRHGGLSSVLR